MGLIRRMTMVGLIAMMSCTAWAQSGGGKSTEDANCGIVYGKGHAFTICAPKGWVLDNGIMHDEGIYAAFYPKGSSWTKAKDAGSVMYVNTVGKHKGMESVEALMKTDAEQTRVTSEDVQVKPGAPIETNDGKALVQKFEHSAYDRTEAVAYIDTPKVIVMIAMSSKDDKTFEADYAKYVELVKSYKFLTTDVRMKK